MNEADTWPAHRARACICAEAENNVSERMNRVISDNTRSWNRAAPLHY